jgi:hypothetical protein
VQAPGQTLDREGPARAGELVGVGGDSRLALPVHHGRRHRVGRVKLACQHHCSVQQASATQPVKVAVPRVKVAPSGC